MKQTVNRHGTGGWDVPCEPFDYRKMEREARQECEAIRDRLQRLKRQEAADADRELIRRRDIRILTDMYYEQRSNIRLFEAKARQREQCQ